MLVELPFSTPRRLCRFSIASVEGLGGLCCVLVVPWRYCRDAPCYLSGSRVAETVGSLHAAASLRCSRCGVVWAKAFTSTLVGGSGGSALVASFFLLVALLRGVVS